MSAEIFIKVSPGDINYVNRIMEGYEYLGMISTVDRTNGVLVVRSTQDTMNEVYEILKAMPVCIEFCDDGTNDSLRHE